MNRTITALARIRPAGFWILCGGFLFAAGFLQSAAHGIPTTDEIWFLQVANRMAGGEILYRDIFFGATPLSVYLAAPFVLVFGAHLWVIKALAAACSTAMGLLAIRIGRRLGFRSPFTILILLSTLAYSNPWVNGVGSLYTPLAYVFLMASFNIFLSRQPAMKESPAHSRNAILLLLAGVCIGCAFAAKQTVGAYAWAAWMLADTVVSRAARIGLRRWRDNQLIFHGACMLAIVALVLLPVAASGGWSAFLDYAFFNKSAYVRLAAIPLWASLRQILVLAADVRSLTGAQAVYWQLQLLLLPVAGICFLWSLWRATPAGRPMVWVAAVFTGAAIADIFPRVLIQHSACALPVIWTGMAIAGRDWSSRAERTVRRAGRRLAVGWLVMGVALAIAAPVRGFLHGESVWSGNPMYAGIAVPTYFDARAESFSRIREQIHGQSIFILSPSAAEIYLETGIRNPTPFDIPLATALGLTGEQDTIARIESGEIDFVCWTPLGEYYLRPRLLEAYVAASMEKVEDLGACLLYRTPEP